MARGALAGAVALTAAVLVAAPAGADPDEPTVEVVVRFDPDAGPADRAEALEDAGLVLLEVLEGSDWALAEGPAGAAEASRPAGALDDVDPVTRVRAHDAPNDPAFPRQWQFPMVQAVDAWSLTTGGGVVVAVIDTGLARGAPDLATTSVVPGWDFIDGDADPEDPNGHGTHVASTIAESTGNGLGAAGMAPGVSLMPVRALDADGAGTDYGAAEALRWAADHGARVANLSFGSSARSSVLADAVAYATSQGVTVVGSSGNEGSTTVSFPAAEPEALAVGSVRLDATRPAYSNTGAALDLVAPGGDLSVDQDHDGYPDGILAQTLNAQRTGYCYCFLAGTSMAAPHVSAVAAMVVARGVAWPTAVGELLRSSSVDLGPAGPDTAHGAGLVQALAAVRAADALRAPGAPRVELDAACPTGRFPASPFADVPVGDVHARSIACMAWWGVAGGTTPSTYSPLNPVTRAQMASFVARLVEAAGGALPASPPRHFFDVDPASVHARRIDQLAAVGVVGGRRPGVFAPDEPVSRDQMASFLVRAHDLVADVPLGAGGDAFVDDEGNTHEANIDRVATAGVAGGTGPGTYAPGRPVTRGQLGSFLARTLDFLVRTGVAPER